MGEMQESSGIFTDVLGGSCFQAGLSSDDARPRELCRMQQVWRALSLLPSAGSGIPREAFVCLLSN